MEITLPIKHLVRLNVLLSLVISAIIFLFLWLNKYEHYPLLYTVMTVFDISVIGFLNIFILIILSNRFERKSKKFRQYRYLLTYAGSAAIYLLVWPVFATLSKKEAVFTDIGMLFIFLVSSAMVNTLMLVSQNFVILQSEKARADVEISQLKIAHAEAANLLLKQQIHPHFLFNALNMLKSLYRKDIAAGDTYIVHLANFLRASIFQQTSRVSRLDEEFALLQDYLEMQQIRFGSALTCTITVPANSLKKYYLPTFSLQPLLENAIKHNELTEEMPLAITIYQNDDQIVVRNNLQKKKIRESSTNNGLANLAERYRLLSEDQIIIKEDLHFFSVSIKLLTDEYSDHRR
jgi:two-component system LytT family sensor kinase